jgi:hypothetical protein
MNEKTRFQGRVFRCINIDGRMAWVPHTTDAKESVSPIHQRPKPWYERAREFFASLPERSSPAERKTERKQRIQFAATEFLRLQDEAARLQKQLIQAQDALYAVKEELRQLLSESSQ